MTQREAVVFMASCQLEDVAPDGRTPLMSDPEYCEECERLAELGWLEPVEFDGKLNGYQ